MFKNRGTLVSYITCTESPISNVSILASTGERTNCVRAIGFNATVMATIIAFINF